MQSAGGNPRDGVLKTALWLSLLLLSMSVDIGQAQDSMSYWRKHYEELTPAHDPRVTRAQHIFARLLQALDSRPGTVPKLWIIKTDPWGLALPVTLPDGWIILSKGVLDLCYREPGWGDDRLAFVLGHEIAHQVQGDLWHLRFFQALEAVGKRSPALSQHMTTLKEQLQPLQDGERAQEIRADEQGITYATLAGFRPQAIVITEPTINFFQEWLQARDVQRFGPPAGSASHPLPGQRAALLRTSLQRLVDQAAAFQAGLWFAYAGKYAEAIHAFASFVEAFPSREAYHNLAVSHHHYALQLYQAWKGTPALPLRLSIALDPDTRAGPIFRQGATPDFRTHIDQAIAAYHEAASRDSAYIPARVNLAGALVTRGIHAEKRGLNRDVTQAVATLLEALEQAPNTPDTPKILNNLGVALFYDERLPQAQEYLLRARTLAPAYTDPVFNLSQIAHLSGQEAEAQRYQREYEQLVPHPAPVAAATTPAVETVLEVRVGQTEHSVPASWGQPLHSTWRLRAAHGDSQWALTTYPNGVMTLTQDGEILMLHVHEQVPATSARGLRPGSGAHDVLVRYGAPRRRLELTQGALWSYDAQRIAFSLRHDRVVGWLIF